MSGWAADLEDLSFQVVPAGLDGGSLPSMAGEVWIDGDVLGFTPRFPFAAGTTYAVTVNGETATIERPAADATPAAEVVAIHPDADDVPLNLLRIYVHFSAPMSEGFAARAVQMCRAGTGEPLQGTFLRQEPELWDAAHRRLTLFLDPARIKRGLVPNLEAGYPLTEGVPVVLRVGTEFRDAFGQPLRAQAERAYQVGAAIRARIDPAAWRWAVPRAGTTEPLTLQFDRPLDHAMLGRCLWITDASGARLSGESTVAAGDRGWRFTPHRPWPEGRLQLSVDTTLEDVAGNAVAHVFDRDLTDPAHDPLDTRLLTLEFACN